jgi:hypothetical protein
MGSDRMVFGGLREKFVLGMAKKFPEDMKVNFRIKMMETPLKRLNDIELSAQTLLVGLKTGEYSNDLMRCASKIMDLVEDSRNNRLYPNEEERKKDFLACQELINDLVKKENLQTHIVWLESFILKFSDFKKALFVFFDKVLPV